MDWVSQRHNQRWRDIFFSFYLGRRAHAVAVSFAVSAFFVGALVSGFEPENLVTGLVANFRGLPQIALGTVVGAAIFMILGGFGTALLIVPMEVKIPASRYSPYASESCAFRLGSFQ